MAAVAAEILLLFFCHWYVNPDPVFPFKRTLLPLQNEVGPLAVTVGAGGAFTVIKLFVMVESLPDALVVTNATGYVPVLHKKLLDY